MVSQREVDDLGPALSLNNTTRPGWRERAARRQQAAVAPAVQAMIVPAEVTPEPAVNGSGVQVPQASQGPAPDLEPTVTKRKNKRKIDDLEDSENLRRSKRIAGLPPASPTRTCDACLGDHPIEHFPALPCGHDCPYHRACLGDWLAAHVTDATRPSDVGCPCSDGECHAALPLESVQQYATDEIFQNYDTLLTQQEARQIPGYRECIAPGCDSGQIHDEDDGNIFTCGNTDCGHRHCTNHNVAFHNGGTCEEYDARLEREARPPTEEELASEAYLKEHSYPCPGPGCSLKFNIMKNGGCDHMTCDRCWHEYCYICKAPYNGSGGIHRVGNPAHAPTCKYHSARLPTYQERPVANRPRPMLAQPRPILAQPRPDIGISSKPETERRKAPKSKKVQRKEPPKEE